MKIHRTFSPDVVDFLAPHFTMHDLSNVPGLCDEISRAMQTAPTVTFVLVGMEEDMIKCCLVAADPGPKFNFVAVSQIWSHPSNPWSVAEEMFLQLLLWAIGLSKDSIRAETMHGEAFLRRAGFVPAETVVRYEITQNMKDKLFKHSKEIFRHG